MLSLYHRLITLRSAEPALMVGSYSPIDAKGDLLAYLRQDENRRLLVVLNFGHQPQIFEGLSSDGRVLLSTFLDREDEQLTSSVALRADEGVIIELY